MTMIAFKNFNLSRLLSLPVASASLGKELTRRNAFSRFFSLTNNSLFSNNDRSPLVYEVEQIDDISVTHSNAAVAVWPANFVFVLRAMDVDEPVFGVCVVVIQAVEPKNTRGNEILSRGQWVLRAKRQSTAENGALRHSVADFFRNLKTAEWGLHAPRFATEPKPGTRDGVGTDRLAIAFER